MQLISEYTYEHAYLSIHTYKPAHIVSQIILILACCLCSSAARKPGWVRREDVAAGAGDLRVSHTRLPSAAEAQLPCHPVILFVMLRRQRLSMAKGGSSFGIQLVMCWRPAHRLKHFVMEGRDANPSELLVYYTHFPRNFTTATSCNKV